MIPVLELLRVEESETWGTFGVLRIQKEVFCVTLEPADRLNRPNMSSIPAQQYVCERYLSARYGFTFKVSRVPDRDNVIIHSGNSVEDTEGCILLGEHFGKLKDDRAILNSGKTFQKFMAVMKGYDKASLTINEFY